jgi:hypothetical protein
MTSGTIVATAAAPVNMVIVLVREAGMEPVSVALREAVMEALPEALLGLAVPLFALKEIGRPLQRPLYAHCELPVQAALKFPHLGIRPELLA